MDPAHSTHRYEEMFPEDFWAEFDRAPIAYFSQSPLEWHGPHCALGADPLKGHHFCLRAAEISGGIVLPPMHIGCGPLPPLSRSALAQRRREAHAWNVSLMYGRQLTELALEETWEHLERIGFLVCMTLGGHLPNQRVAEEMVAGLGGRLGRMLLWAGAEGTLGGDDLRGPGDSHSMDHAGRWETSGPRVRHPSGHVLVCNPDVVLSSLPDVRAGVPRRTGPPGAGAPPPGADPPTAAG